MSYPNDRKYTKDHEWVMVNGDEAIVGITDYAQKQLGDVVFVELPAVGTAMTQGEAFGNIESVKAVSELFAPVTGEVTAVNDTLANKPEAINSAPHETWMIRMKVTDTGQMEGLLEAGEYEKTLA